MTREFSCGRSRDGIDGREGARGRDVVEVEVAREQRDMYQAAARLFGQEVDTAIYEALFPGPRGGASSPDAQIPTLEDLAVEYCRLFVGPRAACPPYASAAGGGALLGGRAAARLTQFLESRGLAVTTGSAPVASADHIAVHLTVLASLYDRLAGNEEASPVTARQDVATFLDEHLRGWTPGYLRGVEAETRQDLYRDLARLTRLNLECSL